MGGLWGVNIIHGASGMADEGSHERVVADPRPMGHVGSLEGTSDGGLCNGKEVEG